MHLPAFNWSAQRRVCWFQVNSPHCQLATWPSHHTFLVKSPLCSSQLDTFRWSTQLSSKFAQFAKFFFMKILSKLSRRLFGDLLRNIGNAAPKLLFITLLDSTCSVACGKPSFEEASWWDVWWLDCSNLAAWRADLLPVCQWKIWNNFS